jgi:hypothetical protein
MAKRAGRSSRRAAAVRWHGSRSGETERLEALGMTSRARTQHLTLVHGTTDERRRDSRRFRGPYAHYDQPQIDLAPENEPREAIADEIEIDLDEMGIFDEQSGVRKKPLGDSRPVPPPIPIYARRRRRAPLVRDPKPIDFEEILLLHPPVSFGGDAIVPPSPGIPIFRVLVVEAAERESSITRVVAHAIESLGEFGLDLAWRARKSAASIVRRSKRERKNVVETVESPVEARKTTKEAANPKKTKRDRKEPARMGEFDRDLRACHRHLRSDLGSFRKEC